MTSKFVNGQLNQLLQYPPSTPNLVLVIIQGQLNQLLQYPTLHPQPQFVSFIIAYFQIQVKFVLVIIQGYYLWAIHGKSQVSKGPSFVESLPSMEQATWLQDHAEVFFFKENPKEIHLYSVCPCKQFPVNWALMVSLICRFVTASMYIVGY